MKNRNERRAYEKRIRNDKRASKCPICGHLSLFYTRGELKPEAKAKEKPQKEDYDTKVICESCDSVIYEGEDVSKLLPPWIYIPIKLDLLDYALRHRERIEELNKDGNVYILSGDKNETDS